MRMKTAQILMECLLEQGVDTVFGYPGGTILNVYDEFELHGYKDKIRHILTAHEQGASHAADGYARATGKVGVCFATSGPGATNLTTGIATAYYDSSPVVFITCNVSENLIGKDSFQEVDITGISMPITKCNYLVKDPGALADVLREAFAIARSGRPGPVLVDIAKNVTAAEADYEPLPLDSTPTTAVWGPCSAGPATISRPPSPTRETFRPCWISLRGPGSPWCWWAAGSSAPRELCPSSAPLWSGSTLRWPPPSWAAAPAPAITGCSPA